MSGQRARGGEDLGNCSAQQKITDVRQGHGRLVDVGWEGSRPECGGKYENKVGVLEIPLPALGLMEVGHHGRLCRSCDGVKDTRSDPMP